MIPGFGNLAVEGSFLVPRNHIVWRYGQQVLSIQNTERDKFWCQFGFVAEPPIGANAITINDVDYKIMTQDLAEEINTTPVRKSRS